MKYALFLGCTVPARARNYEMSSRKVAEALGVELVDIPEFGCCGFPLRGLNQETTMLLAARNLALAEEQGLNITTLCSGCASILSEYNKELKEDEELREEVNKKLAKMNKRYDGGIEVKHFARVLYEDVGLEKIRAEVKRDLSAWKLASYYGCHYLKPSEAHDGFDDPENPKSLERLVEAAGAIPVYYAERRHCCGGAIFAINGDLAYSMSKQTLDSVKESGADAMNLICQFCSNMYDDNQRQIEAKFEVSYKIPVLFYPQVLGLALGMDPKELGLNMNKVKTKDLLAKLD